MSGCEIFDVQLNARYRPRVKRMHCLSCEDVADDEDEGAHNFDMWHVSS